MRILILVSRDAAHPAAAGGDCHLTQLAQALAADGQKVTLASASHPTLPRRESMGNLEILRLAPSRLLFAAVWSRLLTDWHGKFDLVLEEAVGGERAPFLARVLAGGPTLPFWYQDSRPLFRENYGAVGAAAGAWLQRFLLWLNRGGYALTNSITTREWLSRQGVDPAHIAISYPKVDAARAPTRLLSFEQRRDRMVTIGNFRPTKRFEESLEVFSDLVTEFPGAELVLIGRPQDDGYFEGLQRRASELGIGSKVSFRLAAAETEKFDLLAAAKVLTIHSPVEGFGWTITEAGLCGVPAVGNQGVSLDALRDGVNGVRVPFGDRTEYVRAVGRLFRDREWWQLLSDGARQTSKEFVVGPVEPGVLAVLAGCARNGNQDRASSATRPVSG
jgi:glycosyltransferase involved in cell wall biosynthesis